MPWNWRLVSSTHVTDAGVEVEKLGFRSVYYDDNGTINGFGDEPSLEQFGEVAEGGPYTGPNARYDPINEDEAKENLRFTLDKLQEALKKPVVPLPKGVS
jgi:hypothetical protein